MKAKAVAMLTVGLLLSACSPKAANPAEENADEPTVTVKAAVASTKTIRELVPVDGSFSFAPTDFVRLASVAAGKLGHVYLKEGESFRKGQLLAKIDTSVLDSQQRSAASAAASARAQSAESRAMLAAAQADFESAVKTAQINLETAIADRDLSIADARNDLHKLQNGARPQEIGVAQQAVRQARIARDKARSEMERDAALFKDGYVSGQQADASKASFETADSAWIQAQQQLSLLQQGARHEDVDAAQIKLKSAIDLGDKKVLAARAALDQAKQGKLTVAAKAKDLEATRFGATQKANDAAAATGALANGEIRAPFDGFISKVVLSPGAVVDSTTPVLEVVRQAAKVQFVGQASPLVARTIHAGMAAVIPGEKEIDGSVISVGIADPLTGQVPVRMNFASGSSGLFMRAMVVAARYPGAVAIPDAAVVTRDDKRVVYPIIDGKTKLTEVEVGPSEGGFTAILKGLSVGQKVVIVGHHEISDGAKVEEAKADEEKK